MITEFKKELAALLTKYDVWIDCEIDGDTHGIEESICIKENKTNKKLFEINYQSYLDARDLD